jgi:beta-glucosidase
VQLYITAPSATLQKPTIELKAFAKTNVLQPGQKQTLQFEIQAKDVASFDTPTTSWVAEAGNYAVKIGASSENILQKTTFFISKKIVVEKCNKVLVPQVAINELKK